MFFGFTQLVWLEFVKNSKFMLVWMLTVLFAWVGPLYPLEFFYVETELYTDKEDWLYISVYIYIYKERWLVPITTNLQKNW